MLTAYAGELIALSTVLCWTISVQFFEAASKKVGALPVNIIRLTVALILFSLLLFFRQGFFFRSISRLKTRNISFKGVLFGFGGMLGQACGYILSKAGMKTDTGYLDAFSATQIRALSAFVCFLVFLPLPGNGKMLKRHLKIPGPFS